MYTWHYIMIRFSTAVALRPIAKVLIGLDDAIGCRLHIAASGSHRPALLHSKPGKFSFWICAGRRYIMLWWPWRKQ
jgi:hypothetical protein